MTTIDDVAQLAGASIATVSAVINETARVRPALGARVLSAITATIARHNRETLARTDGRLQHHIPGFPDDKRK
jgi:DNA-binding LacI/PurR family transcriptional regulator